MSRKQKHTDQFDKRAANLRENLKRRKEQMRKQKEDKSTDDNNGDD